MSDRMSKSATGSMFDGLQIFGKTDAKFSLTNSLHHGKPSSSKQPLLNSNYTFNTPDPPVQSHSLPSTLKEGDEEDIPPHVFPIEPTSLNPHKFPAMEALDRTCFLGNTIQSSPISLDRTNQQSTTRMSPIASPRSNTDLTLHHGSIRRQNSRQPPEIPDEIKTKDCDLTEVPKSKLPNNESDRLTFFFTNASAEIEQFEAELDKCYAEHDEVSESTLQKLKASEDFVRTSALISIQKILNFESFVHRVDELTSLIKDSIGKNHFQDAENFQSELDGINENLSQSQLLQFKPPRHLTTTDYHLDIVNSSRKSHIGAMKEFCINLDELSTKFTSLSKQIEVKCSSKIEKQKQDIDSSKNMLDCRLKHYEIDNEYLQQKERSLKDELKVNIADHELQMKYQDEQLKIVQNEINDLEERLMKLKSREKGFAAEKQKLLNEKAEFMRVHKQKSLDLLKETEKMKRTDSSLKKDSEQLERRTEEFENFSSQLQRLKESQDKVQHKLGEYKSKTCDSISVDEGQIVNEVHVNVHSEIPDLLRIPKALSDAMQTISSHKASIKIKSEEVFNFQRELAQISSEQLINKSNLETLKGLKNEAISRKQFHQASTFLADEARIEEKLVDISKQRQETLDRKAKAEWDLESLEKELKDLEQVAGEAQKSFDENCHKTLESSLRSLIDALKRLPSDMCSISRSILEYDTFYMYCFLNMIKHRSKFTFTDSVTTSSTFNLILSEDECVIIEDLKKKIATETDMYRGKAVELKVKMDLALKNEDFKTAEDLNSQYEVIAGFDSSSGEDDVILIT